MIINKDYSIKVMATRPACRHMKHDESKIQIACVKWFRYQYPNVLISSFPNGGVRTKAMGGLMKAEGMTAGMPDVMIFQSSSNYCGLCVEFKTDKGVLSKEQKDIHSKLYDANYSVVICRSIAEFMDEVIKYLA